MITIEQDLKEFFNCHGAPYRVVRRYNQEYEPIEIVIVDKDGYRVLNTSSTQATDGQCSVFAEWVVEQLNQKIHNQNGGKGNE